MEINDIAIERIFELLVKEKTVVKLINMLENEKVCNGEINFSNNNKKILVWPQTIIEYTLPWLN